MKIALHYDPVRPETSLCINEREIHKRDVYGFLYPVRSCLLQAWLPKSGSWSGLRSQLEELARGEELEVSFYGRTVDGEDLRASLEGMEQLTLRLHPVDRVGQAEEMLEQVQKGIVRVLAEPVVIEYDEKGERRKNAEELFGETARYMQQKLEAPPCPDWLYTVENEADFAACAQSEGSCVVLEEAFLDSLEKLHRVGELTRSMRRGPDMVWCRLETEQRRRDFAYYAAQFPGLEIHLLTGDQAVWQKELYEKFGRPYQLRSRLQQTRMLLEGLEAICGREQELRMRQKQLAEECKKGPVTPALLRGQQDCTQKLRWITAKRGEIDRLRRQLDSGTPELRQQQEE